MTAEVAVLEQVDIVSLFPPANERERQEAGQGRQRGA